MPARNTNLPEKLAEATLKLQNELVPRIAKITGPPPENVSVSKDERWRRWWQKADDWPEKPEESRIRELQLLGFNPDGTPMLDPTTGQPVKGMSREDVGILMYPNREIDARAAAGVDDDRAMAKYAKEMTDLGPPPPDPLEQAALAAMPPEPTTLATPTARPVAEPSAMPVPEMGVY